LSICLVGWSFPIIVIAEEEVTMCMVLPLQGLKLLQLKNPWSHKRWKVSGFDMLAFERVWY